MYYIVLESLFKPNLMLNAYKFVECVEKLGKNNIDIGGHVATTLCHPNGRKVKMILAIGMWLSRTEVPAVSFLYVKAPNYSCDFTQFVAL